MSWKAKKKYNPDIPVVNETWLPPALIKKLDSKLASGKEVSLHIDVKANVSGPSLSVKGTVGWANGWQWQEFFNGAAEIEAAWGRQEQLVRERERLIRLSYCLPGVDALVEAPCRCRVTGYEGSVWPLRRIIMHLNDVHSQASIDAHLRALETPPDGVWTREDIADWLDALHDDGKVNIEFEPWEEQTTIETLGATDECS